MKDFDWNMVRSLHATAHAGSLSAAAKRLGLTQPTLSRQIAALENQLAVTLFERVGKRLVQTEVCKALLTHVNEMHSAAEGLALAASGRASSIAGPVSISAADIYASMLLPRVLPVIRRKYPDIVVTIIATNQLSDIRKREADIAIRHVRPKEPELIGKLLFDTEAHFYASKKWVKRRGMPKDPTELAREEWLGFEDVGQYTGYVQKLGIPITPEQFRIISANSNVHWEMMKQGVGIAAMLKEVAAQTPSVVRLLPKLPPITVPVWLVTHRELNTSPRIRAVFDVLAEELVKIAKRSPSSSL